MPRNRLTYAVQLRGICDAIVNPWFLHRKRRIFTPSEWYARSIRIGLWKHKYRIRDAQISYSESAKEAFGRLHLGFSVN